MQTTQEEIMSSNEELITARDEMQSINAQLHTANLELQARVDDLSTVRNDLTHLLNSIDLATVLLDNALQVRHFSSQAARLFNLIPSDVGRALSDIASNLVYPGLIGDACEVLRNLAFLDREVASHDGCRFRIKIMPYRTLKNVIDGVVITCYDISDARIAT